VKNRSGCGIGDIEMIDGGGHFLLLRQIRFDGRTRNFRKPRYAVFSLINLPSFLRCGTAIITIDYIPFEA
jgi:hypothetical protein